MHIFKPSGTLGKNDVRGIIEEKINIIYDFKRKKQGN